MKLPWLCLIGLLLSACAGNTPGNTVLTSSTERLLLHDVYLNLKEGVGEEERNLVITELKRLADVQGIYSVQVGLRAETKDPRLNADYDLALHTAFTSLENLKAYAKAPLHLEVLSNIKDFLAGPPVVYDYWIN